MEIIPTHERNKNNTYFPDSLTMIHSKIIKALSVALNLLLSNVLAILAISVSAQEIPTIKKILLKDNTVLSQEEVDMITAP